MKNWQLRLSGVLLVITALWYLPWLTIHLNNSLLWLAIPFTICNILFISNIIVTFINNWERSIPEEYLTPANCEVPVAVIIPTYGEPAAMVYRTASSVFTQEWPHDKLTVIISDDARAPAVASVAKRLQDEFPEAAIFYFNPPPHGSLDRNGDAKAGNLNAVLSFLDRKYPDILFIEVRDADDEVGDPLFLRHTIGQLTIDPTIAFAQTIKEARVSDGDPFGNIDPFFYRGTMLAKNAANAVFPCGSGLVWRRAALNDIGTFPGWNLVEDLQSGVEALRRNWRGIYIPIVGAVAQHAPEDIPNLYKQRGTWALDTMRLLIWGRTRGLRFRQQLHFLELGLFYCQGIAIILIMLGLTLSFFFSFYPLTTTQLDYAIHFWPFVAANEVFLAVMNGRRPYESLVRSRQMWVGLAPVYAKACWTALINGPNRKPVYRVTRKVDEHAWYWRETLPQTILISLVLTGMIYSLLTTSFLRTFDAGSAFWAVLFVSFFIGFMRKSWFGISWHHWMRQSGRRVWATRKARAIAGTGFSAFVLILGIAAMESPHWIRVTDNRAQVAGQAPLKVMTSVATSYGATFAPPAAAATPPGIVPPTVRDSGAIASALHPGAADPIPTTIEAVRDTEASLQTGVLAYTVSYPGGVRTSGSVTFDLGDRSERPVLDLVATYRDGAESQTVVHQIMVEDRTWTQQSGADWRLVSMQGDARNAVDPFLPHIGSASDIRTELGSGMTSLRWHDGTRNADVVLDVDPITRVPLQIRFSVPNTGEVMLVTYRSWNAGVSTVEPDIASKIAHRAEDNFPTAPSTANSGVISHLRETTSDPGRRH